MTCATARPASFAAGNDLKIVQMMLGHSSIVLTADTYTNPRVLHQMSEKPQVAC
jgi:site-specific recombinase XerD